MADDVWAVGAVDAVAITKSDATQYLPTGSGYMDALYIGGAGDVTVVTAAGTTTTFVGVLAGSILPIQVAQVRAATTATDIVGLRF